MPEDHFNLLDISSADPACIIAEYIVAIGHKTLISSLGKICEFFK